MLCLWLCSIESRGEADVLKGLLTTVHKKKKKRKKYKNKNIQTGVFLPFDKLDRSNPDSYHTLIFALAKRTYINEYDLKQHNVTVAPKTTDSNSF